jgi:hypothetical protein
MHVIARGTFINANCCRLIRVHAFRKSAQVTAIPDAAHDPTLLSCKQLS